MLTRLILAVLLVHGPAALPAQESRVVPAGTRIPIRFLHPVVSGRDSVGSVVRMQTMAPLAVGRCVVVPAFALVYGTVDQSRPGRLFGRRGSLHFSVDSVQTAFAAWAPMSAILDSVEWAGSGSLTDSGTFRGDRRSFKQVVGTAGGAGAVIAATGVGAIPAVAVGGFGALRRGPRAEIREGQEGALRLTAPLVFAGSEPCADPADGAGSGLEPSLPPLPGRTANAGDVPGDPINVALRGTRQDLDTAFARAGWLPAQRPTVPHLVQGVGAALASTSAPRAPMSHQYYLGRVEDVAFERASPSARKRHHVRMWQVDSAGALWAGAANEDIGLLVSPLKGRATHRIDPAIDQERDLLVRELMAGGCARSEGYTLLPGAGESGTNVAGQAFVTDGRIAVLDLGKCPEAPSR